MTISASAGTSKRSPQVSDGVEAQRLLHIAADDIVLADLERPAVAGAHLIGRMMADHRRHRTFFAGLFVAAKDAPHMLQRHQEAGVVAILDFHAVIRAVVNAAVAIPGHARHIDIRPAVHLVMLEQRQLVEIDLIAGLNNLLHRRGIFADDHRPDPSRLAAQTLPRHLGAIHVRRHPERDLNLLLRILRAHDHFHVSRLAMRVERMLENQNRKFLQRAEMLDDRGNVVGQRIDGLGYINDLVRICVAHIVEKRSEGFRHEIDPNLRTGDS